MKAQRVKQPTKTLKQFVKDEKRAACSVCKLPQEVREQIRGATDARIKTEVVVLWIKREVGVTISVEDLSKHKSERHDSA